VLPPLVTVWKPTPPESSGVSCATPERPANKIVNKTMDPADLGKKRLNLKHGIGAN
jgi:hypothetical protein